MQHDAAACAARLHTLRITLFFHATRPASTRAASTARRASSAFRASTSHLGGRPGPRLACSCSVSASQPPSASASAACCSAAASFVVMSPTASDASDACLTLRFTGVCADLDGRRGPRLAARRASVSHLGGRPGPRLASSISDVTSSGGGWGTSLGTTSLGTTGLVRGRPGPRLAGGSSVCSGGSMLLLVPPCSALGA